MFKGADTTTQQKHFIIKHKLMKKYQNTDDLKH